MSYSSSCLPLSSPCVFVCHIGSEHQLFTTSLLRMDTTQLLLFMSHSHRNTKVDLSLTSPFIIVYSHCLERLSNTCLFIHFFWYPGTKSNQIETNINTLSHLPFSALGKGKQPDKAPIKTRLDAFLSFWSLILSTSHLSIEAKQTCKGKKPLHVHLPTHHDPPVSHCTQVFGTTNIFLA